MTYYIKLPFAYLLEWLTGFVGSYGLALILFALIVKLILFPFSAKSKKSMMKMSRLTPKVKALEKKYGDDKQKYNEAVNKLYKEEGASTCSGCLWSFIPLLLLLPLYAIVREPITWLMLNGDKAGLIDAVKAVFVDGGVVFKQDMYWQMEAIKYIPDFLSQLQAISPNIQPMDVTFLGINLSTIPQWKLWAVETLTWADTIGPFLLPLISGGLNWLSMWVSQKLNNTVITDDKGEQDESMIQSTQATNKGMTIMMPIVSVIFGFMWPATISIYWIAQSVVSIAQEVVLTKHYRKVYDEEDAIKQQRAAEEAAIEAEKERIREERRKANPDGIVGNASKKKLQNKQKAEKAAAEAAYQAKLAAEKGIAPKPAEEDDDRPYRRGRAYRPDRYENDTED